MASAPKQLKGKLSLDVGNADAFCANPAATKSVADGLAKTVGVPGDQVSGECAGTGRRLEANLGRRLAEVVVAYKINLPKGSAVTDTDVLNKLGQNDIAAEIGANIAAEIEVQVAAGNIPESMKAGLIPTVQTVVIPTVKTLPTTAFTGDPIITVGDYRLKIEFPSNTRVLLWKDNAVELYAKADVATPDKRSQWFSEFVIATEGQEQVCLALGSLQDEVKTKASGELSDMSLTLNNHRITKPGKYPIANGAAVISVIVKTENQEAKDVVKVKSQGLDMAVVKELAKKFLPNLKKATRYSHLDLSVEKMDPLSAENGILAELYGFIPITKSTASMIKSISVS